MDEDHDGDGHKLSEDCDDGRQHSPIRGRRLRRWYRFGLAVTGCDCEADYYDSTHFAVCPGQDSKADSEAQCIAGGYDGLATIADVDTHIITLHNQTGVTSSDRYWIGFTDFVSEGTWVWDSGISSTYTNWISSEPNGGSSENCTLNVATSGRGWGFNCSASVDSSGEFTGSGLRR